MCGSCASSWICACDGGDVFGCCPAEKNVSCPICGHFASGTKESSVDLAELLDPAVLARERAAYEKKQAAAQK